MDIHCSTCNEPWDVYHVRHDAIFEADLRPEEAEAWGQLPTSQQMTREYRDKFKAAGWEFGRSILNVIHCPCCPPGARPDPEHLATKRSLEALFGDDEDGLAATFEDYDL